MLLACLAIMATPVAAAPPQSLSILTYNVHALPWPLAGRRGPALQQMAERLLALRQQGRQPHVVALQEAFTDDAKAIGAAASYRYVQFGPGLATPAPAVDDARDRDFLAAASYLTGEHGGRRVNSGLAILSDYPIVAARQVVYPVCAGYDCLAAKGALAVRLAIPGVKDPVVVVDTHLNSSRASGVSRDRALYAYQRQLDILDRFIRTVTPPRAALFVAGDFNVGRNLRRRAYFTARTKGAPLGLSSAFGACQDVETACTTADPAGLLESARHGKDWLMFRAPASLAIMPVRLAAPFARAVNGSMLSDHIGISATYWIGQRMPQIAPLRVAAR